MFMMLALPLQAFASMAMLGCEHARGTESQASMEAAMSGCHEAADERSAPAPAKHQCSHCADCYLTSALPIPPATSNLTVPAPSIRHTHHAADFSGFIPEGPERPPRTSAV